jgi:hypothetical protein
MPTGVRERNEADTRDQTSPSSNIGWPSGKEKSQYIGYENWVMRQWAWEFLRRNKEFRKACGDDPRLLSKDKKREFAKKFGLNIFKHFAEEYSPKLPRFVTSQVSSWTHISDTHNRSSRIPKDLKLGQALIRFNLEPAINDKRSIDAQLEHARKILLLCLEIYSAHKGVKSKSKKPKANHFLNVLRMWDLKNSKFKRAEIAKLVFPGLVRGKTETYEFEKIYKSRFRSVIELVEKMDYLVVAATED